MSEQEAVRRLVKSSPELWAQCSDPLSLSKHLSAFGEIKITRLEPESTVAWEGESASGTVSLEPSGWGTRVRLTALGAPHGAGVAAAVEPIAEEPEPEPEPSPEPLQIEPVPAQPRRFAAVLSSLLNRRRVPAVAPVVTPTELEPEPVAVVQPEPTREPVTSAVTEPVDLVAELEAALDSLGAAHHRPYSRS